MKGNDRMIAVLNERLAEELTAINQYMVHAEICDNWGLKRLHKAIEHQAMDEMHHAEWHIARIIFLEGMPIVSKLNEMRIGKNVREIVLNDYEDELDAVRKYNESIKLAIEVGDDGTRELLEKILVMEEGHVNWAEEQRDQMDQMGMENYIANQVFE